MKNFTVTSHEDGMTVKNILKARGFSRRLITKLKNTRNGIMLNGAGVYVTAAAKHGDTITLGSIEETPPEPNSRLHAGILYEDDDVIVFDKPPFMPVHQSIKHRDDTLANYFAYVCPDRTFRPVNRLDRDTGGCVAAAKNQYAANYLQNNIEKVYYGLAPLSKLNGGRICAPIAREQESIIFRCVRDDGQYAATNWRVIKRYDNRMLCKFILETGRTHQIRVHMAHIGLPLLGDAMYGGDCSEFDHQALICGEVKFALPSSGEKITVHTNINF